MKWLWLHTTCYERRRRRLENDYYLLFSDLKNLQVKEWALFLALAPYIHNSQLTFIPQFSVGTILCVSLLKSNSVCFVEVPAGRVRLRHLPKFSYAPLTPKFKLLLSLAGGRNKRAHREVKRRTRHFNLENRRYLELCKLHSIIQSFIPSA